jgi:hypothetical protein
MTDLRFENHGSLILVRPVSDAGEKWLQETAPDDAQFFGPALVVEPRYARGVYDAACDAGMAVR